uniref:Chromosome 10 open reading frame 53 n=1 Tax=Hucho hucho TaxID=62062 RepID=A0A4W5R9X7_9TELE
MPQNAVVIVRYGPYKSCGIVDHRTFRLIGLQAALKENGHQSVLEKMSDWNKVELVVNGECVYTCNIKQLEFGGDGKLDPLCKEAVTAVQNAY